MDYPSCYAYAKPKARKEHKCCECGGVIKTGEVYNKHSGIWAGRAYRFKVCLDCEALRDRVNEGMPMDELCPFEELGEFVFESEEPKWMEEFVRIKKARSARVYDWMFQRLNCEENV